LECCESRLEPCEMEINQKKKLLERGSQKKHEDDSRGMTFTPPPSVHQTHWSFTPSLHFELLYLYFVVLTVFVRCAKFHCCVHPFDACC